MTLKHFFDLEMDLLGSIMGSMEKPPTINDAEKKKIKGIDTLLEIT